MICQEPVFYENSTIAIVNPLLIVEILSPSTASYDRSEKFLKYRHLESFKEYVLVQQDKPSISSFYQKEKRTWQETVAEGLDQKLWLPSIEVELDLAGVYRNVKF